MLRYGGNVIDALVARVALIISGEQTIHVCEVGGNEGSVANGNLRTWRREHRRAELCSDTKGALDEVHLTNSVGLR
jgi:hypothetical protein